MTSHNQTMMLVVKGNKHTYCFEVNASPECLEDYRRDGLDINIDLNPANQPRAIESLQLDIERVLRQHKISESLELSIRLLKAIDI